MDIIILIIDIISYLLLKIKYIFAKRIFLLDLHNYCVVFLCILPFAGVVFVKKG